MFSRWFGFIISDNVFVLFIIFSLLLLTEGVLVIYELLFCSDFDFNPLFFLFSGFVIGIILSFLL